MGIRAVQAMLGVEMWCGNVHGYPCRPGHAWEWKWWKQSTGIPVVQAVLGVEPAWVSLSSRPC